MVPSPPLLYVGPLAAVDSVAQTGASHMVTLINAQQMAELATPDGVAPDHHLRLVMNDIEAPIPGLVTPRRDHVARLVAFIRAWDRRAPLFIHCNAGISRSPAAAFIALCLLNPEVSERHIARSLRQTAPQIRPNRRLVRLGDAVLHRNGRMAVAVEAIGPGDGESGALFAMPALLSLAE